MLALKMPHTDMRRQAWNKIGDTQQGSLVVFSNAQMITDMLNWPYAYKHYLEFKGICVPGRQAVESA